MNACVVHCVQKAKSGADEVPIYQSSSNGVLPSSSPLCSDILNVISVKYNLFIIYVSHIRSLWLSWYVHVIFCCMAEYIVLTHLHV